MSDHERTLIRPLSPPEYRRGCRPAGDNLRYFEGMMWMARMGAQWRHLPDELWQLENVFRRHRHGETDMFDAMPETVAEMVKRDSSADMIDSAVIRRIFAPPG